MFRILVRHFLASMAMERMGGGLNCLRVFGVLSVATESVG